MALKGRTVQVIPQTINPMTRLSNTAVTKRKVAGYARVSTDSDEQYTSYEAQVDYYTRFIQQHSDWAFVKVYTDEGISGLSTKKREGFNEMIDDALDGRIDLIITKSVSRFARNTVDSLTTIRKLKDKGIEVFFEKENIWTFDGKGELLLTIMSSLAQEESRSISENVTWGQRKRFSDGKVSLPYKNFLGYERGETKDAPPVVNQDQAVIVRRIYSMFMDGKTPGTIALTLTADKIPTPSGKAKWQSSTVQSILTNEKYRGSARLQKRFTVNFLTKETKKNEGELPQYWIAESHEAIIAPDEWDAVQDEVKRRKAIGRSYSGKSVLSSKLVCEDCGSWYGPKLWHSTDKHKATVWQCNAKFDGSKPKCETPHLTEADVKARFLIAYNNLIANKDSTIIAIRTAKRKLADTSAIDKEMDDKQREIEVVTELIRKCVEENCSTAQNQVTYAERYNGYVERYEQMKGRYDELAGLREERISKGKRIDRFLNDLAGRDGFLTEFDNYLWYTAIDRVLVRRDGVLVFCFQSGEEIRG